MGQLTDTDKDLLNKIYKEYELTKDEVFKHKTKTGESHYTIITRKGIDKIQARAEISIEYVPVTITPDFACIKAVGKLPNGKVVETFGSASPKNSQNNYYAEMAEKRAMSRVVLKLVGLYAEGVYGEDEADAFNRNAPAEPVVRKATL